MISARRGVGPLALNPWRTWYGRYAHDLNEKFIEGSIGESISDSTRKHYRAHFAQWATF